MLTAERAQAILQTNPRTGRYAVSRLAEAGILVQRSAGRRNRVFECADMMDAFTEAARAQPADNLTLSSRHTPGADNPTSADAEASGRDPLVFCNAETVRGGHCKHPRPAPGRKCQAGHKRPR